MELQTIATCQVATICGSDLHTVRLPAFMARFGKDEVAGSNISLYIYIYEEL